MAESLIEMAKDLTMALIENKLLAPEDLQQQLVKTHASLREIKAREAQAESGANGVGEPRLPHTKDWKKSIKKHAIECLVCGQTFKQLSARHLSHHGLDPRTYREQFGIPRNQPLSAKATTAARRQVAQEIRPWEKAPTYRKAQEEQAPTPAPPKRTRKQAATTS